MVPVLPARPLHRGLPPRPPHFGGVAFARPIAFGLSVAVSVGGAVSARLAGTIAKFPRHARPITGARKFLPVSN